MLEVRQGERTKSNAILAVPSPQAESQRSHGSADIELRQSPRQSSHRAGALQPRLSHPAYSLDSRSSGAIRYPTAMAQPRKRPDPSEVDRSRTDLPEAKVVGRFMEDGSARTDTYWGGQERPDGVGHGHAVVDEDGRIRYLREAERDLPRRPRPSRVTLDDRQRNVREAGRAAARPESRDEQSSGRTR